TSYASFCLVRSVVLLAASSSIDAYFYLYWIGQFMEVMLALLVLREIFARVMRPFGWIPPQVVPSLVGAAISIAVAAMLVAFSLPIHEKYPFMALLMSFERVSSVLLLAGFAGVAVLSSIASSPWPRTAFGIELGFLFYLTLNAVAETLAGASANPRPIQLVGRAAFAVALVIWSVHLWKPEPVGARLPENIMDIDRLRNRLLEQEKAHAGKRRSQR
ncbi:MAG: hypothetical protein L0099_15880, partial [Acidobacteria bacterium]|nr:hypothetical protein [Acidobacteriota bacterium]